MAESFLVGHNFVSGICKLNLKPIKYFKNLNKTKTLFLVFKNLGFYQLWSASHEEPANLDKRLFLVFNFCAVFKRCVLKERDTYSDTCGIK